MFEAYCRTNVIVYFIIMLFLSKYITLLYVSVTDIYCESPWRSCSLHVTVRSYNLKGKFLIAHIKTQNTVYITVTVGLK